MTKPLPARAAQYGVDRRTLDRIKAKPPTELSDRDLVDLCRFYSRYTSDGPFDDMASDLEGITRSLKLSLSALMAKGRQIWSRPGWAQQALGDNLDNQMVGSGSDVGQGT